MMKGNLVGAVDRSIASIGLQPGEGPILDPLQASRAGQPIDLLLKEFLLLEVLMRNPGRVGTRTMLLERV